MDSYISVLPSEQVRRCCTVFNVIICIINVQLYLLSTAIIINCSGRTVGAYKWYTIWSFTNSNLIILFCTCLEPELLINYSPNVARGLAEYLEMPHLAMLLQVCAYVFFEINVLVMPCRFIFRYAQNTDQHHIVRFMSKKEWLCVPPALMIIFMIKGLYINRTAIEDGDQFKKEFASNDTALADYVKSHVVMYVKAYKTDVFYQNVVFPSTLIIAFICTLKCYTFQASHRASFSTRTSKLYSRLILGLALEQIILIFYIFIPIISVKCLLPKSQRHIGMFIVERILFAYPSVITLFTLLFYRQYRVALKNFLFNLRTQVSPLINPKRGKIGAIQEEISMVYRGFDIPLYTTVWMRWIDDAAKNHGLRWSDLTLAGQWKPR
ncbi:unnamed protein product [Bursaphelenchus xylophilus]|uniref:(pine wood nematode) hypothetical protein n=1 Tax=Bursaphelenchus xylophilus TaxID=6326 RepID=A0A1I7RJE2_BURXY|nr:unnamed protein product [Bursaphelenchus xylophilus]CAG9128822.1 unnamed protein product [Bursaphelenchus xylophilus]